MIVVDTNAWYWWVTEQPGLSPFARSRLNREREVVVPTICLWEVAMMATRGRVDIGPDVAAFLRDALAWDGVRTQPVTPDIAIRAAALTKNVPMDPADQLVAATAMQLNVPLVTSDDRLQGLPGLQILW